MRFRTLAILLFLALQSPVDSAPRGTSERTIFLEGCNVSLTLEPRMAPIEVQADSFLGQNSSDRSFLALVCRPNAGRTFEPGSGEVSQRLMRLQGGIPGSTALFWSEVFERTDAPVRGIRSWNLRWATRSHLFLLVVYPDPTAIKKGQQDDPTQRRAKLETAAALLLLGENSEPAILESTYRHRLMAAGTAILTLFTAGALLLFHRIRRKLHSRREAASSTLPPHH